MTQDPLIQRALNSVSLENKAKIGINPNPLTFEEYVERTPEKLELYNGCLGGRSDLKDSVELLLMSLQCFGLTNIVSLLPKELWLKALNSAYPSDEREKILPSNSENFEQKLVQLRELRKEFEARPEASNLSQHNREQLLQNLEKLSAQTSDSTISLQAERQQWQSESIYSFYNSVTLRDRQSEDAPKDILVLIRLRKEDLDTMPTKRDWVIKDTLSDATADLRKMVGQILPESCKCPEWGGINLKVEKVELLKLTAGEIAKELAGIWVIRVAIFDESKEIAQESCK